MQSTSLILANFHVRLNLSSCEDNRRSCVGGNISQSLWFLSVIAGFAVSSQIERGAEAKVLILSWYLIQIAWVHDCTPFSRPETCVMPMCTAFAGLECLLTSVVGCASWGDGSTVLI